MVTPMTRRSGLATPFPGTKGRWIVAALVLFATTSVPAMEQRPLVLRHLTTADGLPQSTVMTTLRDSQGFVWFGTEDGLVRYDGTQLVRYARSPDVAHSLPGNYIRQIVEDARHDLWIAVLNGGVARWHRDTDHFDVYQHGADNADSIASNLVRALQVDASGRIWIGTDDAGVDILDPATGHVRHLRHDVRSAQSLSSDEVFTLRLGRNGDLWIGTAGGLDRWRHDADRIERMGSGSSAADLRAQVSQIVESRAGTFWIGSYDAGLSEIDANGRVLKRARHDAQRADSLASDDVRALLQDAAGNLWVGTAEGLELLDPATGDFVHYRRDERDATSLRDSYIMSLYQDPTGLLWIGTRTGGVSRWNPRSWEMGGARPGWLRDQMVMGFADAGGSEVWIASMAGLFRYDSGNGTATSIDAVLGRARALGDSRVMSLREGHDGSLWIGTMTAGVRRLRPDHRLQSFAVAPGQPRALSAAGITSIVESRTGSIWVGTYGGGVNIIEPTSSQIRQLPFGGAAPRAISGA